MPSKARRYRLGRATAAADRATLEAVQSLADYAPRNSAHSAAAALDLLQRLDAGREKAALLQQELEAVSSNNDELEWQAHTVAIGTRNEVTLQYGDDSPALRAVGRTRRSERKRPNRSQSSPEA